MSCLFPGETHDICHALTCSPFSAPDLTARRKSPIYRAKLHGVHYILGRRSSDKPTPTLEPYEADLDWPRLDGWRTLAGWLWVAYFAAGAALVLLLA